MTDFPEKHYRRGTRRYEYRPAALFDHIGYFAKKESCCYPVSPYQTTSAFVYGFRPGFSFPVRVGFGASSGIAHERPNFDAPSIMPF
jgi:hypothetical protein